MQAIKKLDFNELKNFDPAPYYQCKSDGVYYIAIETDKKGIPQEKPPLRLSDQIKLIGTGQDHNGKYFRIIQWKDRASRKTKTGALAMAEIGTTESFKRLQEQGISIQAGRRKRDLLTDYLLNDGQQTAYLVSEKAGWNSGAYILPNGEIIAGKDKRVLYNGDISNASGYNALGDLHTWQTQIARYADGNSRLCLALGIAFASPLLAKTGADNGGVHIYGDSSDGKTTAAKVALSVFGNPNELKLTWRGTDLGFSNAALARNDGLLVLDEIGEADQKTISKTAYSVINGKSKIQGAKDGGNKTSEAWHILLFSTGEYPLPSYMAQAGQKWDAGQEVRLPSIPASAGYGIYESLHGFKSGAALSDHLNEQTAQNHGAALRAWLEQLQTISKQDIEQAQNDFLQTLPPLTSQALRVAKRFALLAAALELARPVTGLAIGKGADGIRACFNAWLDLNGDGKREDKIILESALDFIALHADGIRYSDWSTKYGTDRDHAGYRKPIDNSPEFEYWTIPAVFKAEICKGYEIRKVCNVLSDVQWLKPAKAGFQHQRSDGTRYYVFISKTPPENQE